MLKTHQPTRNDIEPKKNDERVGALQKKRYLCIAFGSRKRLIGNEVRSLNCPAAVSSVIARPKKATEIFGKAGRSGAKSEDLPFAPASCRPDYSVPLGLGQNNESDSFQSLQETLPGQVSPCVVGAVVPVGGCWGDISLLTSLKYQEL